MKLSKRLTTVASYVPQGARIADIGSDHAYLPSYLAVENTCAFAIAGEVVQGPFDSAVQTVRENELEHIISVRLGDGLNVVTPQDEINTITICGMGGDLIVRILEEGRQKGKLETVDTLILQPNVDAQHVRQWLMAQQYKIEAEEILEENKKIYEIIVAKPSEEAVNYSPSQLQFGVFLPLEKNDAFVQKWQSEIDKYEKVIRSLQKSSLSVEDKIAHFRALQQEIKEIIA